MLHEDFEDLLSRNENEHLEFKEAKRHFDFEELVKYAVALANECGGRIILGVTDKKPRKIVGSSAFENLDRIKSGLIERIHLRVEAEEIHHTNGRIVVFSIPSRPRGVPIEYKGAYYMRSGEDLVPMLPDMIRRILDEAGPDFSAEICAGATIEDLEKPALEDFKARWAAKSGNAAIRKSDIRQILADAELVLDGKVTYAALALFGKHEALIRYLPQTEVIFEYRSSDASGPPQQRAAFTQGFFSFYDEIWRLASLRNDLQHYQSGLFVLDIPTFNERAIREAILNAICHRDYRLAGSTVIRQYARRIEIVSPGGLPTGVTFENILWTQAPRNRRLADALLRCGLVERSGQGMNLMFETSIRESKAEPDFSRSDQYTFWLTLHGEIRHPEFLSVLERIGNERLDLFGTEEFLVIDAIYEGRPIGQRLEGTLRRLIDEGLIERSNKKATGEYVLSRRLYAAVREEGVYTRKKGLDRQTNKELLVKHITESGPFGARLEELRQVLPQLDRNQIQVLMRELVKEKRIHSHGKTKAGRWFPGPILPDCKHTYMNNESTGEFGQ
jgi:ATP-dependent DNA helicase RecG